MSEPTNESASSPALSTDLWREALKFAREQADAETKNIERLFNRAVAMFKWILFAALAIFAFFGWTTYSNLRELVMTTTKSEMDKEVKSQIGQQLDHANLEAIVQQELRTRTAAQLTDAIQRQVAGAVSKETSVQQPFIRKMLTQETERIVNGLEPEIAQISKNEADHLVAQALAPRELTSQQREAVKEYLAPREKGIVRVWARDSRSEEQKQFAKLITVMLKEAGWRAIYDESVQNPSELGLTLVVRDAKNLPSGSLDLIGAFKAASLDLKISTVGLANNFTEHNVEREVPNIAVGPAVVSRFF